MKFQMTINDSTLTPNAESLLIEKIRLAVEEFGIEWEQVACVDISDSEIDLHVELTSDVPLTETELTEVTEMCYAGIESELETIRKGQAEEYTDAEINDFKIYTGRNADDLSEPV